LNWQFSLEHLICFLFVSTKSEPHFGQVSFIGLSHKAKSHFGNWLQP